MPSNGTNFDEQDESFPPGPLRLLNPQQKRIFSDPKPKLPESAETLCVCCPAAIWRAQAAGGWTGLCTIFRDELSTANGVWSCEGFNMASMRDDAK